MHETVKLAAETLFYFYIAYFTGLTIAGIIGRVFDLEEIETRNLAASYLLLAVILRLREFFPGSFAADIISSVGGIGFIFVQIFIYLFKGTGKHHQLISGVFIFAYVLFRFLMTLQLFRPSF